METIPAGHLLSLMETPRAEAEGQMKLGVEQLGRFCSLAQIPPCKPPWLDDPRAVVGVREAGAHGAFRVRATP